MYMQRQECALEDGLLGGTEFPIEVRNVSLASGAQIERGMLLSGAEGVYNEAVAGAKDLCIAAQDITADSLNAVTPAYFAGKFNRNAIILKEGLNIDDFEQELRKQNIHLTRSV